MPEDIEEDMSMGPEEKAEKEAAIVHQERPLGDTELDELLSPRSRHQEEPDDLYDGEW